MILKSLYDYAQVAKDKLPKEGMEWKEIEFIIVIDREGRFVRFESRRIDKKRCASFLVAKAVARTSAPNPNILWDNGRYVFGLTDKDRKHHAMFLDIIEKIREKHPEDVAITALSKFYGRKIEERNAAFEKDPLYATVIEEGLKSNFSFRLQEDGRLIAEKDELFRDLLEEGYEDLPMGRCLVTGEYGPIVRTTTPTPLPDNSPMAALVAFQVKSGYDSYGKSQAFNSPISVTAERAISAVLKKFLGKDSKNKSRVGNRMYLYWGSCDSEADHEVEEGLQLFLNLTDKNEADPDKNVNHVAKVLKGIYSGEISTTLDDRFHILGLAPNTGRIAVVFWQDCTLKDFAQKLLLHFEDMEIADYRKPDKRRPYFGVYSMISAVTLGGKVSDALPNLIDETVKSIMYGTPHPMQLLTGCIQRIKAELTDMPVSIQRAAILKACINRRTRNNNQHKQLENMLDKTNDNAGYLCGRLTAVLEKIQEDVHSGDSIRTHYMGAASATPATVFPAMLNLSLHHAEKLDTKIRWWYESLKQEIIDKLPEDGFPAHLDLSDQGRFFVGYYQQRADFYKKKEQ